jgi:hypothetical protein
MKSLRLLRNVAVLFILVMALLAWRPGSAVADPASGRTCGYKLGHGCFIDSSGNCQEYRCKTKGFCFNSGCV